MKVIKAISVDALTWTNVREKFFPTAMSKLINDYLKDLENSEDNDFREIKKQKTELMTKIEELSKKHALVNKKYEGLIKEQEVISEQAREDKIKNIEAQNIKVIPLTAKEIGFFLAYSNLEEDELFLKYRTEIREVNKDYYNIRVDLFKKSGVKKRGDVI